ncbi:MAG: AAA family ATPase [Planctomycetota bacterium]
MQILIVSSDASLRGEVESSLDPRPPALTVRTAPTARDGVEAARSRAPDLIFVEVEPEEGELERFASEVSTHAPSTVICAVYRPEVFGPGSKESDTIIGGLRAGVSDFVRRPVSSGDLRQLLERISVRSSPDRLELGTIVCFSSTKGGVGKSTLAVNTACELARQRSNSVLLIDASLQLGVCHQLLDLRPSRTICDAAREISRLDETLLREFTVAHQSGLHLLVAPPGPIESTEITDETIARILSLARKAYDYVIVDTFPVLESVLLAILDMSDLVYLVSQATVPSVLGQLSYVKALDGVGVPPSRQRIILSHNHAGFPGEIDAPNVSRRLGRKVDHSIPYDRRILTCTNDGVPLILRSGPLRKRFTRSVRRLANEIVTMKRTSSSLRKGGSPSTNGTSAP